MKRLRLLLLSVFFGATGYSQFAIFGVKGGLNLATVTGNDVESPKFLPAFHIGGTANFFINDNFMVQPEVLYSGKGAKDEFGSYKFGYINVPVLAQYKTTSGFFVEAGPQIGFLVTAKRKYTVSGPGRGTNDIKNILQSTDYSFVGGLGYKTAMGIGASARYDFGFHNIADAGIIRNKTIMISIFYIFNTSQE